MNISSIGLLGGVAAIAAYYLIFSGLRGNSVKRARLIGGYSVLAVMLLGSGLVSRVAAIVGAFVLLQFFPVMAIGAIIGGVVMLVCLRGWRLVNSAVIGLVFPVLLFSSIWMGLTLAPPYEQSTVEEAYLAYTQEIIDALPESDELSTASLRGEDNMPCDHYLEQRLSENAGQYSVRVTASVDPSRDPTPIGSTAATVVVTFPDGGEVELSFYNYTPEGCEVLSEP